MHSLRYVLGDDLFLSTLKQLSTDPKYTYDNFVTTKDVEELFSTASKQNLKPFFNFYMYSTDVLEISVKEVGYQKYLIKVENFFMPLPFDISTTSGTNKMVINKEGITVTSNYAPQVDAKGYYLKKITLQ